MLAEVCPGLVESFLRAAGGGDPVLIAVVIGTIWVVNRLPLFVVEMRAIFAVDDPVVHRRLSKLAHDMRKDRRVVPLKWKRRR